MKKLNLVFAALALSSCSLSFLPGSGGAAPSFNVGAFHPVSNPTPLTFEGAKLQFQQSYSLDSLKAKLVEAQVVSSSYVSQFEDPNYLYFKDHLESQGYQLVTQNDNPYSPYAIFLGSDSVCVYRGLLDLCYPTNDGTNTYVSHLGNSSYTLSRGSNPLIIKSIDGLDQPASRIEVDYQYDSSARLTSFHEQRDGGEMKANLAYHDSLLAYVTEQRYMGQWGMETEIEKGVADTHILRNFCGSYVRTKASGQTIENVEMYRGYSADDSACAELYINTTDGNATEYLYTAMRLENGAQVEAWNYFLKESNGSVMVNEARREVYGNYPWTENYDAYGNRL